MSYIFLLTESTDLLHTIASTRCKTRRSAHYSKNTITSFELNQFFHFMQISDKLVWMIWRYDGLYYNGSETCSHNGFETRFLINSRHEDIFSVWFLFLESEQCEGNCNSSGRGNYNHIMA